MPTIQLESGMTVSGDNLKEIPVADWLAEGEKLFGNDRKLWKFRCPNCGHVQSVADFIELREKKISDVHPETAYFSCIGRFDTRIKKVGEVGNKISPCNYTNGGLFCLTRIFVINTDGSRTPVFEYVK
jgi:hypothetical protein